MYQHNCVGTRVIVKYHHSKYSLVMEEGAGGGVESGCVYIATWIMIDLDLDLTIIFDCFSHFRYCLNMQWRKTPLILQINRVSPSLFVQYNVLHFSIIRCHEVGGRRA